jgi:iron(III) transport system ATP-binding protein
MTMATHVAVINRGVIEQFGFLEELVRSPASAFVATFVGTPPNNIVPVIRNGVGYKVHTRVMEIASPPDDAQFAMFPPERLAVRDEGTASTLPMELVELSVIAGRTMVTATDGMLRLTAIVDNTPKAHLAERVHMELPRDPACWFDASGRRISA